ncbi:MAG TPA: hypothetical protein ENJ27_02235 [Candidatus Moranbacteria bacterium]|nr:hypothetical protein [Candidatus Moranbacteria bacterium]
MQTINVRRLQRNMKDVAKKVKHGKSFAVFKNSTMIFQINPVPKEMLYENNSHKKNTTTTLHDIFKDAQFNGGKNLSKQIDDIVYN